MERISGPMNPMQENTAPQQPPQTARPAAAPGQTASVNNLTPAEIQEMDLYLRQNPRLVQLIIKAVPQLGVALAPFLQQGTATPDVPGGPQPTSLASMRMAE